MFRKWPGTGHEINKCAPEAIAKMLNFDSRKGDHCLVADCNGKVMIQFGMPTLIENRTKQKPSLL